MRFYLKMIEPQLDKINRHAFKNVSLSSLPGFETHLGLQIEYLLLQNRELLLEIIGLSPTDVVRDGPYLQSSTTKKRGCQIDYLIQTSTKTLFVCEFKFKKREIGLDIIEEIKEKIHALKIPRGFSIVPVLFHISGVSANVESRNFFYRIIDIEFFLKPN